MIDFYKATKNVEKRLEELREDILDGGLSAVHRDSALKEYNLLEEALKRSKDNE